MNSNNAKRTETLPIGTMVRFNEAPETSFRRLKDFGIGYCQLAAPPDHYLYGTAGRRNTRLLMNALEEYDIGVTSLFISFPDQNWSDPLNSVGLTPPATRAARIARACRSTDWAKELGITQIASHVGCVAEDTGDPDYAGFVAAMRAFCLLLEANGQVLAYETGMETVDVQNRLMNDIGVGNQRINFDPANMLIYNKDDPMKLVERFGHLVVHVHCKDANRPAAGENQGREVRLGTGQTGFPDLFRELYRRGYRGPLTIEREIDPGSEQDGDIRHAVTLLKKLKEEVK
ncbi:MAG: sugar phosphate isomerase/epimerase [Spirochaetes bacterium]|nr:sugar phosphate isomerase/epimerase [Spirochaetota bacterium]